MKTYLIFIIQGYEEKDEATEMIKDIVTIELIDKDVTHAIARAKEIIKKKYYRVTSIIEHSENEHGTN